MLDSTPTGWLTLTIQDIADLSAGGTPKRDVADYYAVDGIRWVKSGELRQGAIFETEEKITELGLKNSSAKLVPAGTPILAMYGATAGVVGWLSVEAATNQAVLAATPKAGFNAKFIYFLLTNVADRLIARQQGGAQPNLSKKLVATFPVVTPPLPEQERIAEILTSVDDSIRATEAVIAQAERVKRGLMEDLLTGGLGSEAIARGEVPEGWKLVQLSQITTKIGSGVTPKGGKEAYVEEGIPLVRSQNVGWGKMLLDDVAFITHEQHEKMASTKLLNGDVLLNITGASIGRSAVYRGEDLGANVNQHVCILRPTDEIDAVFLNAFLISHRGQNQIDEFQAGGNRQGLNFKQIGSFRIPVPPIDEQRTTAKALESVEHQIEANRQTVAQLQTVKRGLMDDFLTGRVRTV